MSNQHQAPSASASHRASYPSPYGVRIPPPPPILRKSPEPSSHSHSSRQSSRRDRSPRPRSRSPSPRRQSYKPRSRSSSPLPRRSNYAPRSRSRSPSPRRQNYVPRSRSRSPSPRRQSYAPRSDPRIVEPDRNRSFTTSTSRRQKEEKDSSYSSSRFFGPSKAAVETNRREEHRSLEPVPDISRKDDQRHPQLDALDRRGDARSSQSDTDKIPTPVSTTSIAKSEQKKNVLPSSANTSYLMQYAAAPVPTESESSVVRSIVNPELVKIPRRKDEGAKPIFDREELKESIKQRMQANNVEQNPPLPAPAPPVFEQRVVAIIREPLTIPPPQFVQPVLAPTVVPILPNSHYPAQGLEPLDVKEVVDYRCTSGASYKLKNREAPPRMSMSPVRGPRPRSFSPVIYEPEPCYSGSRQEWRPSPPTSFEPNNRRVVVEGRAPVDRFRNQYSRSPSPCRNSGRSPMEERERFRHPRSRTRSISPPAFERRMVPREKPSGDLRERLSGRNELLEGPPPRRGRGGGRGMYRGTVSRRAPVRARIGYKRPPY